jgi:hypothetical protein
MAQQPPQIVVSDKKIHGPIHAVPCPWCGKANNCKNLSEAIKQSMEAGTSYYCDHCRHLVVITKVIPVTVVEVRQSRDAALDPGPQASAAATPVRGVPTSVLQALQRRR